MMERVRIGVLGCGLVAQVMHIPHLRELDGQFEIAALGPRYGVARCLTDWKELVALSDIDAVLICTPGSHAETAVAAALAGKHLLVEKPMCLSLVEADAMIAAAEEARVTLIGSLLCRVQSSLARSSALVYNT
jgi:predicted dehydrogenase